MISKVKIYFQETRREFKRVNWPTRQQTIRHTIIVVVLSLSVAAFLGALDYIFTSILTKFVL